MEIVEVSQNTSLQYIYFESFLIIEIQVGHALFEHS